MWLGKAADLLNKVVRPVSGVLHGIGVAVLVVIMFLTAADVIGRYVFNRPILGAVELIEFMMAIVVAFCIAYCAVMKGHVRVELVVERLPQRAQAIIDSITSLLGFGLFSLIAWRSFVHLNVVFDSKATSLVLLIPVFPFVGVVTLCSAMFALVLLADFLNFLSQAVRR